MMPSVTSPVPWISAETIEAKAKELRSTYRALSTPVDSYQLATSLGIPVYQATFPDESIAGAIRCHHGSPEILVRSGDPITRQAFTVAHELGHFALHWKGCSTENADPTEQQTFVDSDSELYRYGPESEQPNDRDRRYRETQANMFAASLLMPEDEVRLAWEHQKDVKGLARRFRVSQEAMRFRLDRLELW